MVWSASIDEEQTPFVRNQPKKILPVE